MRKASGDDVIDMMWTPKGLDIRMLLGMFRYLACPGEEPLDTGLLLLVFARSLTCVSSLLLSLGSGLFKPCPSRPLFVWHEALQIEEINGVGLELLAS